MRWRRDERRRGRGSERCTHRFAYICTVVAALSLYAAEAEAAAEVKDLQVVAESKEDDDDEEEEESKTSLDDNR